MADKTIKIPMTSIPFVVYVNGVKYVYEAGSEVTVPEEVAEVIEQVIKAQESPAPENGSAGSGGTGGAQPDWNAAPGEPGHVLNRTHWTDKGEILLPESTPSLTSMYGMTFYALPNYVPVELGGKYTVTWNGVDYDCVAENAPEGMLPVPALTMEMEANESQWFGVACIAEEYVSQLGVGVVVIPYDGSTNIAVSIKARDIVHKIPTKYLPSATIINCRDDGTVDKSFEEICSHIASGDMAFARESINEGTVKNYSFVRMTDSLIMFSYCDYSNDSKEIAVLEIDSSGHYNRRSVSWK